MSKAVELRQVLFAAEPETHRPDLCDSLRNLGIQLSHLKQWGGAAGVMSQAVELGQVLYSADPVTYRYNLFSSLYSLAIYHSKLEQWLRASQTMEQVVIMGEALFATAPDTHRKDLTEILHFLLFLQVETGDEAGAARTLGRIMEMRGILVTSDSNAYRVALASPGNEVAWWLRESGKPEQGLKYVLDAINVLREAESKDDLGVMYNLCLALDTAAACLHDSGRSEEALEYSQESVILSRSCVERAPSDSSYTTNSLSVMEIYSSILKSLGQSERAEEVSREMAELRMRESLIN